MHRKHTKSKKAFRNRCKTEPVYVKRAPHKMFTVLSEYIGYTFTSYSKVHTYSLYQRQCTQSTYISRVPQCLSPRPNWDPQPLSRKRVCLCSAPLPPPTKGEGDTRLRVRGWGGGVPIRTARENPCTLSTLWQCTFP
jgi:hypothetical protein